MKMFKKKAMISFVAVVAASVLAASGCSSDEDDTGGGTGGSATGGGAGSPGDGDGDGDGDGLGTCEALCDAASSRKPACGTKNDCLTECGALEALCEDEMEDYLDCGADQSAVICVDGISLGIIPACQAEAVKLGDCADSIGGGGAGGGGAGGGTP